MATLADIRAKLKEQEARQGGGQRHFSILESKRRRAGNCSFLAGWK